MAQPAQRRTEEEIGGFTASQLNSIATRIPGRTGPTHPCTAPTARAQATNVLMMWQLVQILNGERPPEGSTRRSVYDHAVQALGEGGGLADARQTLMGAHTAALRNLHEQIGRDESVGDRSDALIDMLTTIDRNVGEGNEQYLHYDPHGSIISGILRSLRGGEVIAAPGEADRAVSRAELPLIQQRLEEPGSVVLISSSAEESVVSTGGTVTPTTQSLFGGAEVAQQAMTAIGNAYATMANHPNDLAAQQAAASALHQALAQIPADKEVWNSTVHPRFAAAMQALQAGNLQQGLSELAQEPAFNTVFDSLNDLYVITIRGRAISIMRAGVTVRYEFEQNQEAFTEFIRGAREGNIQPRVLWIGMGLHYEYLLVSGVLERFQINPQAGTINTVSQRRISGHGHIVSATPQIGFGFSLWGAPVEAVLHATVGYQSIDMSADVTTDSGEARTIDASGDSFYVGVIGAEIRFPGREGQRSMIRIPRVSLGNVGAGFNPYFRFTVRGTWHEGNTVRISTDLTPQYSYFLERHRVGFDVQPVNFEVQLNPNLMLYFGPGFRYDVNPQDGIHTLEGYGRIGLGYSRGVSVDIRGGVVGETGGQDFLQLPTSGFGALNLTLTPQLWFQSDEERRIPSGTRPRRVDDE
ncbi:hypothetical protein KKE92_04080 [Candidatus Micrarchaeota archaeon]|nr:hypothetical protein [Candidatus Micrarchaeota archaeon]